MQKKYRRIAGRQNGKCYTAAYQELLAGYTLYRYLGITSDEQIVRNEHGKPDIAPGYKKEHIITF